MTTGIDRELDEAIKVQVRGRVESRDALFFSLALLWGLAIGACGEEAECGDCLGQGYRINPSSLTGGPARSAAVLFSGWRNGWCQENLVCAGNPDVFLGELNPGPLDYACDKEELVAFSPGQAPTIGQVNSSLGEMTVPLNVPTQVDVSLWIVKNVVSTDEAQFDADDARGTYAHFGTGIDLVFDIKHFPSDRLAEVDGNPATERDIYHWAECELAPEISRMTDPGDLGDRQANRAEQEGDRAYQPGFDAGRLNVYYVAGIKQTASGINCGNPPDLRPDIMFIDGEWEASPATLAHEVGHALGLRRGVTLPDGDREQYGHVDELELDLYLPNTNLMESTVEKVGQVTVGQIYRMHYDELSWLWQGHERRSEDQYPRTCQSSPVGRGACPPLTLHPSGGWP